MARKGGWCPLSSGLDSRKVPCLFPNEWPWVIEPTRGCALRQRLWQVLAKRIKFQFFNWTFNNLRGVNTSIKNRHGYEVLLSQPYICARDHHDINLCSGRQPLWCAYDAMMWGMCPKYVLTGAWPASRVSCPTAGPYRLAGLPRLLRINIRTKALGI